LAYFLTFSVNIYLEYAIMFKLIKTILKLALLLFIVALIFDLHYQGRSIRHWSKEYAWKLSSFLYEKGKALVGKDLKDLTPSSFPQLQDTLKSLGNEAEEPEKKKEIKKFLEGEPSKGSSKKTETLNSNMTKLDQLSDQDRAKLKKLLEQKRL